MAETKSKQFQPASGTRDFLADQVRVRQAAFATIRRVFERHGFEALDTPALERLEVLTGKYGEEGERLIFKILKRGEQEATGEADLALRYDLTVPLARVAAGYQLPTPYKRYQIAPVWRADRPGKGRFREFVQCDLDTVGSSSPLADAEVVLAVAGVLRELGVPDARVLLNSRKALTGLLEAYEVPADLGAGVLVGLDKLDKLEPGAVAAELTGRGLDTAVAARLVEDLTAADAEERMRAALKGREQGRDGLGEIDRLLSLVEGEPEAAGIVFTPRLVRGLDYYTGVIFEAVAEGMPGSIASGGRYDHLIAALGGPDSPAVGGSLGVERILPLVAEAAATPGRVDVAVTVMGEDLAAASFRLATAVRRAGVSAGVYLGASGKLGRQLKWANEQGARFALLYGAAERDLGQVTVRDMVSGEQSSVPVDEVPEALARRLAATDQHRSGR